LIEMKSWHSEFITKGGGGGRRRKKWDRKYEI
jgi:hypothetical protein